MKCRYCGIEIDNPVIFDFHEANCLEEQKINGLLKTEAVNYSELKLDELKKIAKENGIKGYASLNKDELVSLLKEGE